MGANHGAYTYTHKRRSSKHSPHVLCFQTHARAWYGMTTSMHTKQSAPVVCLGCGEVAQRSSDRRNLKSSCSQHVVSLWKTTIASELQKRNQLADLDSLISGSGEPHGAGYMCRRCFYSYEKVLKAKAIIESNAAKVLDCIVPVINTTPTVGSQRTSSSCSTSTIPAPPPKRRPPPPKFASTPRRSQSPDVAVNILVVSSSIQSS